MDEDQTVSSPQTFSVGGGCAILHGAHKELLSAEHELIFVTCFWAKSKSLADLSKILSSLSAKAVSQNSTIRVRVCLSSLSLSQMLLQTSSIRGHVYKPNSWPKKLGLPSFENLRGLDLKIKSVFVLPFSVMHPKFVIIDRKTCLLPSCNVSWEDWFEGCISLQGPVVDSFLHFWRSFWGITDDFSIPVQQDWLKSNVTLGETAHAFTGTSSSPTTTSCQRGEIETIFLPSKHHRNPHFRPFSFQSPPTPPQTPLNTFLLRLFATAKREIFMQTPNLTSSPVLAACRAALLRGVHVRIITNERLMRLEQLVTAGTTTAACLSKLVKQHRRMAHTRIGRDDESGNGAAPGTLCVDYYSPGMSNARLLGGEVCPQQSHLKLTVVDRDVVVLGSGNMDRASWYTSQELGVAFYSAQLAETIMETLERALDSKLLRLYDSR